MSSPNEVYWSYINEHFEHITAQSATRSPDFIGANTSSTENNPSSSNSPPSSPTTPLSATNPPCTCDFDFCAGFCAGLSDAEAEAETHSEHLQPDACMSEYAGYAYWVAMQEAQAVEVLVDMYIASPDPQASVDSISCETGFEMRVWAQCTRVLRGRRERERGGGL